ncbi:MAG: hypothetical protein HWE18_13895 [Gammaproteobacteria bacterium]|nr:hypothetical protein [Gammaproteobacteria bacterium]
MTARMLFIVVLFYSSTWASAMTAEQAHNLIQQQTPELLGDGSQLVSVYFFGKSHDLSVVGLERVGDDYLPIRWLVIIESQSVLGWYYPTEEFPVRFENGHLIFPKGTLVEDVNLLPHPPANITLENRVIPFYPASSTR